MPSTAALQIRTLQPEDLLQLLALYRHLHVADDPLPEPHVVLAVWQELLACPRTRLWGGFVGDTLIATCTLVLVPNLTRACRPYGLIENVVTHADHRGAGHARAVLLHVLSYAWEKACYKVMLMTGRKDEATLRFYDSVGFDRQGKQGFVARPPV